MEIIKPPIGAPIIVPKAIQVPNNPKALPISFLGTASVIIPWLVAIDAAAPTA